MKRAIFLFFIFLVCLVVYSSFFQCPISNDPISNEAPLTINLFSFLSLSLPFSSGLGSRQGFVRAALPSRRKISLRGY